MKENKPTGIVIASPKVSEVDKKKIKDALNNKRSILQKHWLTFNNIQYIKVG